MVTSEDGTEAQKKVRGDAWRDLTFGQVVETELESEEIKALLEDDSEENLGRYLEKVRSAPRSERRGEGRDISHACF